MRPRRSPYPRLAEAAGVTPDLIYKLRRGDLRVSSLRAMQFERLTGVHRDLWLYPEQFGSPWEAWEKAGFPVRHQDKPNEQQAA